jgi:hypothetical protein
MTLYDTSTFSISTQKEIYEIYVALAISAKAQKGAYYEYAIYRYNQRGAGDPAANTGISADTGTSAGLSSSSTTSI